MAQIPTLEACERMGAIAKRWSRERDEGTNRGKEKEGREQMEWEKKVDHLVKLAQEANCCGPTKRNTVECVKMELYKVMQTYARIRKRTEETKMRMQDKERDPAEAALNHLCKLMKIPRDKDGEYDVAETSCAEFFMDFSLPKGIQALAHFTSLRTLVVVNCSLCTFPPLSKLMQLERADLTDNKITFIPQGSQEQQPTLRELVLDSNRLITLDGVDCFPGLRCLSTAANRIACANGAGRLPRLEKLNLAGNCIQHLSFAGDSHGKIKVLNLSGNPIEALFETTSLAALEDLVEVHFSSPEYGACPIVHRPSYFCYLIFHLPKIKRIDNFVMGKHSRQLGEASYLEALWDGDFYLRDRAGPDLAELEEIENEMSQLTDRPRFEPDNGRYAGGLSRSTDRRTDMEDISWIESGGPDLVAQELHTPIEQMEATLWAGSETPTSSLSDSLENIAINFTDAELDQMRRKIDEEVYGYRGRVPQPLPRNTIPTGGLRKTNRSKRVPRSTASTSSSGSLKWKGIEESAEGKKSCKTGKTLTADLKSSSENKPRLNGVRTTPSPARNAEGVRKTASPARPRSTWSGRFGSPTSRDL